MALGEEAGGAEDDDEEEDEQPGEVEVKKKKLFNFHLQTHKTFFFFPFRKRMLCILMRFHTTMGPSRRLKNK